MCGCFVEWLAMKSLIRCLSTLFLILYINYIFNLQNLDEKLKRLINSSPNMLFMKGSPEQPRCGQYINLVGIVCKII